MLAASSLSPGKGGEHFSLKDKTMKLTTLTKPSNFPLEIKTTNLAGDEVTMQFTAIGRTLRDWMPLALKRLETEANERLDVSEKQQEAITQAEKADAPAKPIKAKRIALDFAEAEKSQEDALNNAVAKIREFAVGWDLEDEFTDEKLKELIVMFPGIQGDGWEQYDARIKGNRTKNSKTLP